jgi:hypothetical protein
MHDVINDIGEGFMDCIRLTIAVPVAMFSAAFAVIRAFVRHE